MSGKIILTNEDIINIKDQIEGAKKEICKVEQYILAYKGTINFLKNGIKLNEEKLAKGEVEREIVNGIDLSQLKIPCYCYYSGYFSDTLAGKRRLKGIITSSYHGRFEYQLHNVDARDVNSSTCVFEGFDLGGIIKTMDIRLND